MMPTPNNPAAPEREKRPTEKQIHVYGFCDGCGIPEHLTGSGKGKLFCAACAKEPLDDPRGGD